MFRKFSIFKRFIPPNRERNLWPRTIAGYRERFKKSPCGNWSHAVGTFGMVMNEHWEFKADHTGVRIETGTFSGDFGKTVFEWKEVDDFTIAIRVTEWFDGDDEDNELEEVEVSSFYDGDGWETLRYDFIMTPTDVGEIVGMVTLSKDGKPHEGFWLSEIPLSCQDWE